MTHATAPDTLPDTLTNMRVNDLRAWIRDHGSAFPGMWEYRKRDIIAWVRKYLIDTGKVLEP